MKRFSAIFLLLAASCMSATPLKPQLPPLPSAILTAVPANGQDCLRPLLSAPTVYYSVSPDRTRFAFFTRDHNHWRWGVIDPNDSAKTVAYSGIADNGFDVGFVWSPMCDELAVTLGYAGCGCRILRVSSSVADPAVARICAHLAATPTEEVNKIVETGPSRVGPPVWAVNGKYYEAGYLAQNDGVARFAPDSPLPSHYLTPDPLPLYGTGADYVLLTDIRAQLAHAFTREKTATSSRSPSPPRPCKGGGF